MTNDFLANVAQPQSQKPVHPQDQKATQVTPKQAEVTDKKELSPRGKLIKELNALVLKIKGIDKRETKAKNALENAKKAMAKIEEERAEVEALAKKFELANSASL